MPIKTIIVLFFVVGASKAEKLCVQQENCTLTVDDPGINTKSCKGFVTHECDCVQRRSVNFEFDCECCKKPARERRDVPLEAMFGLKTYVVPTDSPRADTTSTATTTAGTTTITTQKVTEDYIQYQKLRVKEENCGKHKIANTMTLKAGIATSLSVIDSKTIRATHATTAVNCWNLCRWNVLSGKETCTAVGFIEDNAQKFINDCYILSESPTNSTGSDTSVDIYEICV